MHKVAVEDNPVLAELFKWLGALERPDGDRA